MTLERKTKLINKKKKIKKKMIKKKTLKGWTDNYLNIGPDTPPTSQERIIPDTPPTSQEKIPLTSQDKIDGYTLVDGFEDKLSKTELELAVNKLPETTEINEANFNTEYKQIEDIFNLSDGNLPEEDKNKIFDTFYSMILFTTGKLKTTIEQINPQLLDSIEIMEEDFEKIYDFLIKIDITKLGNLYETICNYYKNLYSIHNKMFRSLIDEYDSFRNNDELRFSYFIQFYYSFCIKRLTRT